MNDKPHKRKLADLLERNKHLNTLEPVDDNLILRWLLSSYDVSLPQGKAVWERDKFIVMLHDENEYEWRFLKQHLRGTCADYQLEQWKKAVSKDLLARRLLLAAIRDKVSDSFKLPIEPLYDVRQGQKPAIGHQFICRLYQVCVVQALSLNYAALRRDSFGSDSDGVFLGSRSSPLIWTSDKEQQERVIDLILEAQKTSLNLSECKTMKRAYEDAVRETKQCQEAFRDIIFAGTFAGKCEHCISESRKRKHKVD